MTLVNKVSHLFEKIQEDLFQKSIDFREESSHKADSADEFKKRF